MNELTTQDQELNVVASSSAALILDVDSMRSIMDMATMMAKGRSTIPAHLAGNPSDCAAVIMQAINWKMNPWAVAQKTHVVNGALGYEAQLVNAVIQSSGVTVDRFNYEWYGPWEKIIGKSKVIKVPAKEGKKEYEFRVPDYGMNDEVGLGVRVWATLKGETVPRVLDLLLVQAAVRNSPLWATDPKQQLAYLAVKRWARLFSPDVILGVYTPDEYEQDRAAPQERNITPGDGAPAQPVVPPALMSAAHAAAATGMTGYNKFWSGTGKENRVLLAAHHEQLKADAAKADADRTVGDDAAADTRAPAADPVPA